ncbi:MAG: FG-GAP repeat protein [Owenweeksia sp.]|nr:FG-GAP repeat protein [Owenweeksia sp.]
MMVSRRTPTRAGFGEYWYQQAGGLLHKGHRSFSGHAVNHVDVNCDGFQDIYAIIGKVLYNGSPKKNLISHTYLNPNEKGFYGSLSSIGNAVYTTPMHDTYHPKSIAHGDLNGDHKPDLAVADSAIGLVLFFNESDIKPRVLRDSALTIDSSMGSKTYTTPVDTFTKIITDTLAGFYLQTTRSSYVLNTYRLDTVVWDTTKKVLKAFCEHYFEDTTVSQYISRDTVTTSSDTTVTTRMERIPWDEQDYEYSLTLHPIPTRGQVYIKIRGLKDDVKDLSVQVFNDHGKHVLQQELRFREKGMVDLTKFRGAVYRFVIQWQGHQIIRSVVKY